MKNKYFIPLFGGLVILILWLFSSCITEKQDTVKLLKINSRHPEVLPKYCAKEYPAKVDSFTIREVIPGKTITETDTVIQDSIRYITKRVHSTDTMVITKNISTENTAKLSSMTIERDKWLDSYKAANDTATDLRKWKNIFMWVAIGLLACWVVFIILKIVK